MAMVPQPDNTSGSRVGLAVIADAVPCTGERSGFRLLSPL